MQQITLLHPKLSIGWIETGGGYQDYFTALEIRFFDFIHDWGDTINAFHISTTIFLNDSCHSDFL
jgi:hypothetical protein